MRKSIENIHFDEVTAVTTALDRFQAAFREEHRAIRDTLLDLGAAFAAHDLASARPLLEKTAALTGPHFRYEEEAMYPALVTIFGEEYIEKLLGDHDRAIGAARRLAALTGQERLTDQETSEAIRLVRGLLPHVSDCEGLSIMVERLPTERVQAILAARERAQGENLDLLTWATSVRTRPAAEPEPATRP